MNPNPTSEPHELHSWEYVRLYVFHKDANLPDSALERVRGGVDYKRLNAYRYVIDVD